MTLPRSARRHGSSSARPSDTSAALASARSACSATASAGTWPCHHSGFVATAKSSKSPRLRGMACKSLQSRRVSARPMALQTVHSSRLSIEGGEQQGFVTHASAPSESFGFERQWRVACGLRTLSRRPSSPPCRRRLSAAIAASDRPHPPPCDKRPCRFVSLPPFRMVTSQPG